MKKRLLKHGVLPIVICMLLCMVFGVAGCSGEWAQREYDSDEAIAKLDRSASTLSVFNPVNGGCSLTARSFTGRRTLWDKILKDECEIEIRISLSLSAGKAKVVHIDRDNTVTTLIERTPETSNGEAVTVTASFTDGINRLKFVGCDCEYLNLKILFDEP